MGAVRKAITSQMAQAEEEAREAAALKAQHEAFLRNLHDRLVACRSEDPLISSESRFGCNATLLAVHFLSWVWLRLAFAALSLHDKSNGAVTSIKGGIFSFTVVFEISSADRK